MAEGTLKNNATIEGYIDSYFSSKMASFDKNSTDGDYLINSFSTPVTLNMSSTWSAVAGTSTFSITGMAKVTTTANVKTLTVGIICNYTDELDWNSYDELSDKGYFSSGYPSWVNVLGYLEVVGDKVQDNIFAANYNIDTRRDESRSKVLE